MEQVEGTRDSEVPWRDPRQGLSCSACRLPKHRSRLSADLPDDEAATARSLATNSAGAATATFVKLLTAEQVDEAFKRSPDYRPPGQ